VIPLCDTNVLGELSRPRPNPGVVAWARSTSAIALSVVSVEEVVYGLAWKPRPKTLAWFERFVAEHCTVLPVTERIARAAGSMRGRLQAQGETRTQVDMLIAATALVHEAVLVTRNTSDFTGCGVSLLDPFS
jgi:toxin FitB